MSGVVLFCELFVVTCWLSLFVWVLCCDSREARRHNHSNSTQTNDDHCIVTNNLNKTNTISTSQSNNQFISSLFNKSKKPKQPQSIRLFFEKHIMAYFMRKCERCNVHIFLLGQASTKYDSQWINTLIEVCIDYVIEVARRRFAPRCNSKHNKLHNSTMRFFY